MLGSFSCSPLQAHTGDPNDHILVSPPRGTTPSSHNVNRVINNDQDSKIRVLSWNINGLGNKMTDPDLFTFIRNYDIIFFKEKQ